MDVKNIKTFVRVAELKSFTKAAEDLNYVQSTVTMQVQQLEKELGYPLFDRIGKRISLTVPGAEFLSYAYEILHSVSKAENIGKTAEDLRGTLCVGVTESLMFGVLTNLLPQFKARYKNLDLTFKTGHIPELIEGLKHNSFDIIYVSKSPNTDPDLCCHYAKKESIAFFSSPQHSLASAKKIPMTEILQNDLVVTEKEGMCYGRLRELAAEYNTALRDSVEVDSVFVITELVEKGMGLGFLPEYAVEKQVQAGELIKLDADIKEQVYYSQILCHKNRWISPFMAGFIDMICSARPEGSDAE